MKIVVSGVNLDSGGTLSILQDCLYFLNQNNEVYETYALVHDKTLFTNLGNINFIEIRKAKSSYLLRLFYEYIYFFFISKKLTPHIWLSLHDMTPNVSAKIRAVYCHNTSPFYEMSALEKKLDKKMWLFNLLYKYVYKINLTKNQFVIVQQNWIADKFVYEYGIGCDKMIVAQPEVKFNFTHHEDLMTHNSKKEKQFFYPAYPRSFKNFEVVCKAANELINKGHKDFEVVFTISGQENDYSRYIYQHYGSNPNIKFIGIISREEVYNYYESSDCLLFPSRLESWGLPISEYKGFNKPMLVANMRYAIETVGDYINVGYFDHSNYHELARLMLDIIRGEAVTTLPQEKHVTTYDHVDSWGSLFEKISSSLKISG